ncbi:hypothetical protein ACSQ67_021098 [Phaseolus vulgaris]
MIKLISGYGEVMSPGEFSVKSTYKCLVPCAIGVQSSIFYQLWRAKAFSNALLRSLDRILEVVGDEIPIQVAKQSCCNICKGCCEDIGEV